jgi:predicted Fe-Mo cluster-binding NifX family protein
MKIAMPIYNDSISNVFDFAHSLLLVDIENGKEIARSEIPLVRKSLPHRIGQLKHLRVNIVVCGAISQDFANMISASEIQLLPYITGRVDDVLKAYLSDQLVQPKFAMPGNWPGIRRGFRCRRRGCRWQSEEDKTK